MTHALGIAAALVVLGCSGARSEPCTPEARQALLTVYEAASSEVINSGACDKYERAEQCPPLMALEVHFLAARKGICP